MDADSIRCPRIKFKNVFYREIVTHRIIDNFGVIASTDYIYKWHFTVCNTTSCCVFIRDYLCDMFHNS